MKITITVLIILIVSLLTQKASADQLIIDAGLGILSTKGPSLSQDKFAEFGVEKQLYKNLQERATTGLWLDSRGEGKSSSGFLSYQIGYEIQNNTFETSIFFGPSLITSPDTSLGGVFQFHETIDFGLLDFNKNSLGINYSHFSSAGIETPNIGRDTLGLYIKFGL